MRQRVMMRIMAAAMVCASLAGCLAIKRPYPDKKHFLFEVDRARAEGEAAHPDVMLQVKPFMISPRYEGQEFVYRTGAMRYESDFYNQFFLAPSGLVSESAVNWLDRAGIFGAVFGATAPVRPTHQVSGLITALYGDYAGGAAKGVVEVQLLLTRDDANQPVIVMQRDYAAAVEAKGGGAAGLMAAWNEGLRDILGQIETDLRVAEYTPKPE